MLNPLGPYAAAYLLAMLVAVFAVRNRPALLSAMTVVAAEWFVLRFYHDLTGSRSTVLMHSVVDFTALYALIRWVPVTPQSMRAEHVFRAMLALHFAWALMLASNNLVFSRFVYLSLYNGLGYLAMLFIAGGALKDEIARFAERSYRSSMHLPSSRQSVHSEKKED